MSLNPSLILGLNKGTLKEGADADVVLVDMNREYTVNSKRFISKGKNTPFNGMRLKGRPVMTICKGRTNDFMAEEE
jgi:dihydroorotase